jgi:Cellulase (glycosyl hydrolase family 5)
VRLSRRAFVQRSAAAAALAGTVGWPARAEAAVGLRKCVAMDSLNHGGDTEDLRVNGNLEKLLALGTHWVRIWIRWDKAQLFPPVFVPMPELDGPLNDLAPCGPGCGFRYIQAIDEQIALARAAGLNVILTTWFFPRWANGTADKPADWAREDRGSPADPVERLKPLEWRIPVGQLGETGYYGMWLAWLIDRYRGYGRNFVLEIMNEPNGQLWPQQAPSPSADPYAAGEVTVGAHVAEMIATARAVSADHGHPIGLAGPALSDRARPNDRLFTTLETAAPQTLDALPRLGFAPTPTFAWTHHNYFDIERNISSPTRAELVRELLHGRWSGRGGPADPRVWLTEGGARLGSGEVSDLAAQALLVAASWERMTAAPGIELFSNYLMYADPVANSGLCESIASGGAPRPLWEVFQRFPA